MPPTKPHVPAVSRPNAPRSRATTGKALSAAGGDLRAAWSRRMLDIYDAHVSDLGGQDAVSQAEASIMRRAATITTELERLEAKFASGESTPTDLDLYQRSAGNLRRLLESVGLQRRAKPVQSLAEYLASRTIEAEAEAEDDEPEADEVAQ
jgi:hypothetical protein